MPEGEEMFAYHGYNGPCPKPAPAEVPMLEPHDHPDFVGGIVWSRCELDWIRTYGDAREAAGYARGLKENSAGNETLAHELDLVLSDDGVTLTPGAFRALTFVRAALRGEVKP